MPNTRKPLKRINPEIRALLGDDHQLTREEIERAQRRLDAAEARREKNKNTISMTGAELYPPRIKNRSKRGWNVPMKG
jgi:hypothetical protein